MRRIYLTKTNRADSHVNRFVIYEITNEHLRFVNPKEFGIEPETRKGFAAHIYLDRPEGDEWEVAATAVAQGVEDDEVTIYKLDGWAPIQLIPEEE
jgi:hypothetical protein